jgi:hypothetical protein
MTDPDQPQPRTDPIVDRVNELGTTFLDILGALLLSAGAAYGAWQAWGVALGLAVGGFAVTLLSGLAQARARPRAARVPPGAHPHREFLPGPEDPGNLHVAGRGR